MFFAHRVQSFPVYFGFVLSQVYRNWFEPAVSARAPGMRKDTPFSRWDTPNGRRPWKTVVNPSDSMGGAAVSHPAWTKMALDGVIELLIVSVREKITAHR